MSFEVTVDTLRRAPTPSTLWDLRSLILGRFSSLSLPDDDKITRRTPKDLKSLFSLHDLTVLKQFLLYLETRYSCHESFLNLD